MTSKSLLNLMYVVKTRMVSFSGVIHSITGLMHVILLLLGTLRSTLRTSPATHAMQSYQTAQATSMRSSRMMDIAYAAYPNTRFESKRQRERNACKCDGACKPNTVSIQVRVHEKTLDCAVHPMGFVPVRGVKRKAGERWKEEKDSGAGCAALRRGMRKGDEKKRRRTRKNAKQNV